MPKKIKSNEKIQSHKTNQNYTSRRAVNRTDCHNIKNSNCIKKDSWTGPDILLYEEQRVFVQEMSRSPPPSSRSWYLPHQASAVGPPPMPNNTGERISPSVKEIPPEWHRWIDQYRRQSTGTHERSPPGESAGAGHSLPKNHLPSPHAERPVSPRIEHPRHLSPRMERHSDRRPPSPIFDRRPISPHAERRPCSPRTDRRPPSPWSDRRPPSPRRERPVSPQGERRPASPRMMERRPLSPRLLESRPSGERRPLSPRRERPPSPRRERLRSPPRHWRVSPPRHEYPPPDWRRRSRSPPPHWFRRSPTRYGPPPPRGRSPPRGHWGPPPPWDRYSAHREYRWAPPPLPPHGGAGDHRYHWERPDRRMESRPQGPPKPVITTALHPPKDPLPCPAPDSAKQAISIPKSDDGLVPPGEDKEEEIETFDLPNYDAEVPLGQKYVIAVSGYFCKICHKFYNNEQSAKITHCKSRAHYDKFSKWLSEKQEASILQKREASVLENSPDSDKDQPAKKIKLEENNNIEKESESKAKYDPTEPTADVLAPTIVPKEENLAMETEEVLTNDNVKKENIEIKAVTNGEKSDDETPEESLEEPPQSEEVPITKECMAVDESMSRNSESASESDALVTNDNKKDTAGIVEATLYNFRKMRVNELKANLEKRGLKSTGLKTLLLKRLEKVLLEEAASEAAQTEEEESNEEPCKEEKLVIAEDDVENEEKPENIGQQYVVNLHESDIEPSNNKTQWINERELERELLQLDGVTKINSISCLTNKVGRKSVVEWTVNLQHNGVLSEEGLQFEMPSHQTLPYKAVLASDEIN